MDEFSTVLRDKLLAALKSGRLGPVSQTAAEIGEKYESSDEDLSNFIGFAASVEPGEVEKVIEEALSVFVGGGHVD